MSERDRAASPLGVRAEGSGVGGTGSDAVRRCHAPALCPTRDLCSDSEECSWPLSEDWHGWRVGDANLHVGEIPGRKSVVLYTMTHGGSVIHPLAYFKTREDARTTLDVLDRLAGA